MESRIKIKDLEPNAYQAMYGVEKYLSSTNISKTYKSLIKIRASQINRCAFCIQMHTRDARLEGETEQRIYALSAWRETPFFTPEERVVLALTEEVTLITNNGVSDAVYKEAEKYFDDNCIAQLIMTIVSINGWNRIAVATRLAPEHI
ncbi:alkylhydroperoxidase AhpD family core domain protein [Sporocytophaga myxococcoides]|uniref:Alkylhydroperoxidase AhpD family core domain protein n=1 Tax=Sporocytophaga myxococcoides TaxID=153721 RepID=A0A098L8D4_9BACT|nr:carboxymuconolactone decarboxylase family protein [Sporocytophaga myxococcoides]GAL82946.1 alkylhydroperoxidase AhpD family core domain protein [Sporocytophaga myxococcoides]